MLAALSALIMLSAGVRDSLGQSGPQALPHLNESGLKRNGIVAVPYGTSRHHVPSNASGLVSSKTGARARVSIRYAARFQAYIDDLENNYGARVIFMTGIRPGRCSVSSQHPCGKALDLCQLRRGIVDRRCKLPDRVVLSRIAASHDLFEGGRWCNSDYGHAQIDVTAAACGNRHVRRARRAKSAAEVPVQISPDAMVIGN
jgi:hypothetical protein